MADISYSKINWENEPSHNTPLSAQNLNKMDTAIDELVEKSNSLKPNPTGTPTEGLEKLEYDGTVYEVKGGHKVLDDSGTLLAQKDNLQFKGVYSHNVGDNSEVDIVREFQSKAEIEALTGEAKKGFEVIEDTEEYIPYTGSDILFDNTDTSFEGENVQEVLEEVDTALDNTNDRIDDVIVDLSGYKHVEFRGTTASFSAGKATITHNLGKNNTVIPLPNGGLVPFAILNTTQNSFEIQVVWVTSANVADSPMATNYTGNFGVNYFLVY